MRQRLGQHFLRDPNVVKTILTAAELKGTDSVLEIGPGKGILTDPLASRVARLLAVELDDTLAFRLQQRFATRPSVQIVHADILKVDLDVLAEDPSLPRSPARSLKILGNLPYSITSPIFEKLMPWPRWETGVFLIQREVATRMAARPGSRDYGILTLAVQLFAEPERILPVKPGAFIPPPKVSSSVVRLRRKEHPLLAPEQIPDFFDLVHGAFAHRRKTIANSLALHAQVARSEVEKWLARYDIAPECRAETVALPDYAKLSAVWSIFRRALNLT